MTSSGWGAYYLFFLAGGAALAIPLLLHLLATILRRSGQSTAALSVRPSGGPTSNRVESTRGLKFNTRYFHGASLSIALVVLALVITPYAAGLRTSASAPGPHLLGILLLSSFGMLSVLYVSRKRDARWLEEFRDSDPELGGLKESLQGEKLADESRK
jgi:hypothetical protein